MDRQSQTPTTRRAVPRGVEEGLDRLLAQRPLFHEAAPGELTSWAVGDEVLRFLAERVAPGQQTLETGAGMSTVVFALAGAHHTCITPVAAEVDRIRAYCAGEGISLDHVTFEVDCSDVALPRLETPPLDMVLVDGSHSLPETLLDWYFSAKRLRPGGIVVVDNTDVATGALLRDFLDEDPDWHRVATFSVAVAFRLAVPFRVKGWWEQPYVVRRSDLTVAAQYSDLDNFEGIQPSRIALALVRRGKLRAAAHWARRVFTSKRPSVGGGPEVAEPGRAALLARSEEYDRELEEVAERVLGPDSCCVDVGAHTGTVLQRLQRVCPFGSHVAFEPIPELATGLRARFPDVTVHEVALAETKGESDFEWVTNDPAYSGLRRRAYDRPDPQIRRLRVRVERMDDVLPRDFTPELIKIDVEGGELGVMRGAVETLRRSRPFVVFEAGPRSTGYYGVGAADLYTFLDAECGLAVSTMRRWLAVRPAFSLEEFEAVYADGSEFYFLAHPPGRRARRAMAIRLQRLRRRVAEACASRLGRATFLAERGWRRLRNDGLRAFLRRVVRVDRWGRQLLSAHAPSPPPLRAARGGVLVVDWQVPAEDHNAGALRLRRIIRMMREQGLTVDVLPFDGVAREPSSQELRGMGVGVVAGRFYPSDYIRANGASYDLCWVNYADLAELVVPTVEAEAPELPIVFDTVDLHFVRESRRVQFGGRRAAAQRYRELELDLVRRCAATVVVTEVERTVLSAEVPGATVHVLPTIHEPVEPDATTRIPFAERRGLLFVGSFPFAANGDAAVFLVEDVLPHVEEALGVVPVFIVGPDPDSRVQALADPARGIAVTGWVPDLEPLYRTCRLSVAPLLWGAGMKGKIGEALARGLPVVTTTIGAEGMELEHEVHALIADGAERFAAEVVRLYKDEALWQKLADAGRRRVEERYSPAAVQRQLEEIVEDVGSARGPNAVRTAG